MGVSYTYVQRHSRASMTNLSSAAAARFTGDFQRLEKLRFFGAVFPDCGFSAAN